MSHTPEQMIGMPLRECVELFGRAWAVRDIPTLESLLAPEYVHTDIQGRVFHRQDWLAYAMQQPHGTHVSFRDLEFHQYENTALVFGGNEIEGGSMGSAVIRFTQVWRANASGWQRLAFQATLCA